MSSDSVTGVEGHGLLPPVGKPTTHTPSFLQQIYQCTSVAALAMASYFFISHFVLQTVEVVGSSMAPTLYDSQRYLLNRWVYYFRSPQHSDVVVLRDPVEKGFVVKRVIGTAGDCINLKDGKVYLNGRRLVEPYLMPGTPTFPYLQRKEESILLAKDEYFVLGDNRKNSADSRTYGPVSRQSILGMVVR